MFCGDENTLVLDGGEGDTTLHVHQIPKSCTLHNGDIVNFMYILPHFSLKKVGQPAQDHTPRNRNSILEAVRMTVLPVRLGFVLQ